MPETVTYSVADGIATITLNRPERLNAVNDRMHKELPVVWEHFRSDPDAVVAIVTGSGGKAFCTGADIADLPQMDDGEPLESFMRWTSHQNHVWKPVICAVNGLTVGGGLHFVADSDIVIASESASFCDTHVNVGLVSGLEPVSLARRMPLDAVLRLALIGREERISAKRALSLSMVGEVVPAGMLIARATEIAGHIAKNSPTAMARTKKAIWQSLELSLQDGLRSAWNLIAKHNLSQDFTEGCAAFIEKRAPVWHALDHDDV